MSALVINNAESVSITVSPDAQAHKLALVAEARDIASIEDEFTLSCAADVGRKLRGIQVDVEAARKEIKAPVLNLGRAIDTIAEGFVAEVSTELHRITKLINDYTAAQRRKAEEAERARQAELRRIEDEKRKAEAEVARKADEERKAKVAAEAAFGAEAERKAKEEQDRIARERQEQEKRQAELNAEKARLQSTTVAAPKLAGVAQSKVWRFEVTDIHALYAHNAALVRFEPAAANINAAIKAGMTSCPGLKIWQEDSTTLRR